MVTAASPYDVVVSAGGLPQAAAEIAVHLGTKGFCVVDPGLPQELCSRACIEANDLSETFRLLEPPDLIANGLLGAEGSSSIFDLTSLESGEAPHLRKVDAALGELVEFVGVATEAHLGFGCEWRTHGVLHETGLPTDFPPEMTEEEAATWLSSFSRAKIMVLAILGPIRGTLELTPYDDDIEPFDFSTIPGSIILLRSDLLARRHFAHSRAYVLTSFLLSNPTRNRKEEALLNAATMPPCAVELENWTLQRLQEVKQEEVASGNKVAIPQSWRSAMDRMFHVEQRCAIRGIAGRFCGTWNLACWCSGHVAGVDLVTEVPLTRWDHATHYDPDPVAYSQQKVCLKHSSFVDGLELFDCRFFGLSVMEAKGMDPHQRQVLEVGYEACFRAGYKKNKLMNCVGGVYLGGSMTIWNRVSADTGATGAAASINSNRFSFCLGMKGPSMTVDTEGASSLTAVHLGADAVLEKGRGVLNAFSLAGGVYYSLGTLWWPAMQAAGLLSRTGRCLTWDASADGYCFGDGCGFVVQKRMTEMVDGKRVEIEGENLEGIIAGSSLKSAGQSAAMNAPNGPAMQELIAEVCRNAGISGSNVDCLECDGRGMLMGDIIEVDSSARILRRQVDEKEVAPLALPNVRTHMGFGSEVNGIASLLRVVVSNRFGHVPPNCHLNQINPYVEFDLQVNYTTELADFAFGSVYGGVSARGFGGTNAHVLAFGEPDSLDAPPAVERRRDALEFWPGGGGELDGMQVPSHGYFIVGTWASWKPAVMEPEGAGAFGYTVTLGENGWEAFQILLDADPHRRLHPSRPSASSGSTALGPDAGAGIGRGLSWRISAPAATAAALTDAAPGDGAGGSALLLGSGAAGGGEGGSSSSTAGASGIGERYRVRLKIAGKFRAVTWERLQEPPRLGDAPSGMYYVTSSWNGWGFDAMQREGDAWHIEVLLLRDGGEFQIVRNMDWMQLICPDRPAAAASVPGTGPDDGSECQGLTWRLDASAGDVVRISLARAAAGRSWSVSWCALRREALSDEQQALSRRVRLGVAGSWTDFSRQQPLEYDGESAPLQSAYSFLLRIGSEGVASFQLLQDMDWSRLLHPHRFHPGTVVESLNDGSAMDLVWRIADGRAGDVFRVTATVASGKVVNVTWSALSNVEVGEATRSGRTILEAEL